MSETSRNYNLPPECYPMLIEFLHPETREVLQLIQVRDRGLVMIPAVSDQIGIKVDVRVLFGDGTTLTRQWDDI